MTSLLDCLQERRILLADGAMGTMLFQRGLKAGDCPEKLNLDRPDILEEIALAYLKAGADIIQTNTFGASPLKLAQYSLDDNTEEINASAVRAVRNAVDDKAFISASVGPCGKLLLPYGDTNPEEIQQGFERQAMALAAEGLDMICIETMTDIAEAALAIKACKTIAPSIPVCATMTFDSTPRGFFTIMGVNIEQAAKGLKEAGADIIGSNCGNGIDNMIKIAAEFKKHTELPLIIQSNAGLPVLKNDMPVYLDTPEFMADKSIELIEIAMPIGRQGVIIIGGCCGTTPEHIAAFREVIDEYKARTI
ncbi:MAG: homocysteine S-methyltransferase family protein [candidate division Zixibacteria bacterium]|nr:homocysteine S-methyltransferase family protein [candidate division Zixibacteria bacterium]